MKISELIGKLEEFDEDMDVHFSYDYGDHARTEVAPKIKHVEELGIKYSDYHKMDRIAYEDEEEEKIVVVLST